MPSTAPTIARTISAAVLAVLPLVGVACGDDDAASGRDDVEAFCTAVDALDATDGTTEDQIVIHALQDMRRTAPAELREDVELLTDFLILTDYPEAADESMTAPSNEERTPAARRVSTYVDEHCDVRADDAAGS